MTVLVEAENLSKSFFSPTRLDVVENISLQLNAGKSLAIMGKSGEGKSTLLHMLGTLEEPTSGTLRLCGERVTPKNAALLRNRHIGFIFQNFHLLEDFTVLFNVLLPAQIARDPIGKGSPAHSQALKLLERLGLAEFASHPTRLLSGGQRQRVAIARALCNDPAIILADEPTGNLDHATATSIQDILFELIPNKQRCLLLVSHDKSLAEKTDNILVLSNKKLISY